MTDSAQEYKEKRFHPGNPGIIDFRLRPPYVGYIGTQMYAPETLAWIHRVVATNTPAGPESALQGSMSLLIDEMDAAGITIGVAQGRHRPGTQIPNETLFKLTQEFPGRFVVLGSVNVLDLAEARAQIESAIGKFGFPGISLDLGTLGLRVDDRSVYPIYEQCSALGACVTITLSMLGSQELELVHPTGLDRAARDFPQLNFVSAHGSYPYVLELIGVACKRPNVWLSPDMYMTYMPGADHYIQAAKGYLQDRTLFGTAYPYTTLGETVSRFAQIDFSDEVREKLLWRNAKTLLKIS